MLRIRFGAAIVGSASLLAVPSLAQTVYVDGNLTTGLNDGSSWADAHQGPDGLQVALNATTGGERLFVADGTYIPAAVGMRAISFRLRSNVEIYGGFLGGESDPDQRPAFGLAPSILSADLAGDDGMTGGSIAENSYHVLRSTGANATAVLDGFVVTGGNSNSSGQNDRGGGILCLSGEAPTIRNCEFISNRCTFGGGAGYLNGSAPTFQNVRFIDNIGGAFGGAFDIATGGAITFDGCWFENNSASRAGALEIFATNNVLVANCVFVGNRATGTSGGGGLWIGNGGATRVRNCTIVGNSATAQTAGGIRVQGAAATISNTVIWGNTGPGGAQASANQVTPGSNVNYCLVEGGFAGGTGNVMADPNFVNAGAMDFRLALPSPAVDAGDNSALPNSVVADFDGARRYYDEPGTPDTGNGNAPLLDLGAYEFSPNVGQVYCDANGNSTGPPGKIDAQGSPSIAANNLTLVASDLPAMAFGYFIASRTRGFVANPNGSGGNLCLSGAIGRFVGPGQVQNTGAGGSFSLALDLAALPQPTGLVSAQVGESWAFQAWHRDSVIGIPTSNFTDGVRIIFE